MNLSEILQLIKKGESEDIEFKRDFAKSIGEEICAFANSEGGTILIGVSDNGEIIGHRTERIKEKISSMILSISPPPVVKIEDAKIERKRITVVRVMPSKSLCSIGGIAYVRVGTSKRPLSLAEILAMGAEYVLTPVDSSSTPILEKYLSKRIWEWFLKKRAERGLKEVSNLKEKLGIVKKVNGARHLTLAGALFFYERPQEYYPHAHVRIIYREREWERLSGPVWKMAEEAIKRFKEIVPKFYVIHEAKRKDYEVFPLKAVREALINALVHRNYAIFSEVFLNISPMQISIRNPGNFPPGTTPEDPKPVPRNPILYELMFQAGYVERQGSGIELIKKLCAQYGVEVKFKLSANFTEIIFKRKLELPEDLKKILEFLQTPKGSGEVADFLKISKPTAIKKLKELAELEVVQTTGKGPATKWKLKD